ncbi:hypothetical protein Ptr902_11848 [Pyrenophora tritici-repentis]|uniref:Uncharacterized protein n=1 Tax=Pyrenophora tritici-repentis TaxID=45151 RepID=A0A5M9LIU5_9PLEO|nr:hypothetical protein PtrV1_04808 [Pyrenophora tritici-repentis]KAF7452509.1 hypothetical protein A1F99_042870 [Pyrenophora tritici-repentis]KAF7574357.1 hypothetical protein PtrM4_059800 [Pyrenophora tritici-repentis]KAI0569167.1 hypothetical protein Alg215_11794 [Pyrenophora tritici-repentis]KAI0582970.1 hypothetical protein Alg130_05893 [Pyrenophora tritici-repentis]
MRWTTLFFVLVTTVTAIPAADPAIKENKSYGCDHGWCKCVQGVCLTSKHCTDPCDNQHCSNTFPAGTVYPPKCN